ncbi:Replicase polyprotein 1ab [Micromonospora sp. NPDC000207]|uniref:tetratricopeptide repeat protein n=1 Tax=Micromonospora sp. NPDC000207 TaxID=3154246 RepID=UPI00332BCFD7
MSLAKPVAESVARHLVATGALIDEDPEGALAHALAARRLASRISAVREAVGLAAYHAGEWQTAIAELRTYHRMTGEQSHLAVIADSERALGRPERAIDLFRGADQEKLDRSVATELLIVAAGARGDLGQKDAAVAMLQVRELTAEATEPWTARLRYAYADALLSVDRREEAREWFSRAAEVDVDGETDAAERLLELDGVLIEGDEEADDEDVAGPDAESDRDDRADRDGEEADGEVAGTAAEDETGDSDVSVDPAAAVDRDGDSEPRVEDSADVDRVPADEDGPDSGSDPADRTDESGTTATGPAPAEGRVDPAADQR